VQVQNKLQLATPLLPQQVQQSGIRVTKSSSSFLLVARLQLAFCPQNAIRSIKQVEALSRHFASFPSP